MQPRERPILFSAPMIQAILAGRKTQTRRVVKPQPPAYLAQRELWNISGDLWGFRAQSGSVSTCRSEDTLRCPYGQPGDRLWVRETWAEMIERTSTDRQGAQDAWNRFASGQQSIVDAALSIPPASGARKALYRADFPPDADLGFPWRPSIFMPRWASRITLEVTDVRVERLQAICKADIRAEGLDLPEGCKNGEAFDRWRALWDSINGKSHPWDANPFVWVVSFKRQEATHA